MPPKIVQQAVEPPMQSLDAAGRGVKFGSVGFWHGSGPETDYAALVVVVPGWRQRAGWPEPLVNLETVGDCGQRASARDRESAAKALREAYAAGRLTVDEFGDRVDAVYSAVSWGELGELTADLPEGSALGRRMAGRCLHRQVLEGDDEPRHPFAPLWGTVAIWLAIAAVAHVFAAIPLVLLSVYVLAVAHRAKRRRRWDDGQPGVPEGCCRWREEPPGPSVL